ncbi:recombinase family protein [Croceitalea marina]|uniref:Recombinase family protein n=1 Tax=Croceitalea marina TaxID=1775166 RepID=A0ABW5N1Q4_9FLAO
MKDVVAIYARISQEKDDIDISIPQQIEQGKTFAKAKGLDYQIYKDEGYSGTLPATERPAMYQLLQDIVKKDSKIKILWGREMFRLYRGNIPKMEIQMVCKKHNVDIYYADKKFNSADALEKLMDNMLGVMGEFYVDLTKQNVKQAIRKNFDDGKAHGIAPYGYTTDENKRLTIDEEQAKWVRKMFEWHIGGMGVTSIANKLMDMGVQTMYDPDKTRYSKKWDRTTVYGILNNKLYYGFRTHNDWRVVDRKRELISSREIEVPHLAIIDEMTYNESSLAFEQLKSYTGKRTWHKYLLGGLLYCSYCGSRYNGRSDNRNEDVYRCNTKRNGSCKNRDIRKSYIERFIWVYISDGQILLDSLLNRRNGDYENNIELLTNELKALENRKEKLNSEWSRAIHFAVSGELTESELRPEKERITKEKAEVSLKIKNIDKQIKALSMNSNLRGQIEEDFENITGYKYNGVLSNMDDLRTYWSARDKVLHKSYPYNEKQKFLNKYLNEITVNYINGLFKLTIKFNLPIENKTVYMDRKFYVALDYESKRTYDLGHPKKHNFPNNLNSLISSVKKLEENSI